MSIKPEETKTPPTDGSSKDDSLPAERLVIPEWDDYVKEQEEKFHEEILFGDDE